MTQDRIQRCCKAININIGYLISKEVYPRTVTERNKTIYLFKDHFCLIWEPEGNSFNKALEN